MTPLSGLLLAAAQDLYAAQRILGELDGNDLGVARDYVKSLPWLQLAAAQ